jgi:hypothetical protein
MAQHDYTIANQGAVDFRNDINSALGAVVSQNSGDTEPQTTFANMLWYDSANNILKIRNEADDAWIEIFNLDQSLDKVFYSSIDIDSGNIDGTTIGSSSAGAGTFTSIVSNNGDISANGFKFYRHFSSTLSYNAEFQLGSISAYEGSWFLISCWNNSGGNSQDGAGIACTGDNGKTLLLTQTGVMHISASHNWGSPPQGYCLVGRESGGNKIVVKNTLSGVTLQVRVLRLI